MTPRQVGIVAAATVLASALPRVLLAADLLPRPLHPFVWSDVLFTYVRALGGHRLPYRDAPFEYPPAIGAIAGALSLATSDAAVYVAVWSLVLALAAALAAAALARAATPRRALVRWALAPQLLLLSGLNFDVLPAALLTLAVLRARRDALGAAMALALGTAAKLFPAASLPFVARTRAGAWLVFAAVLAAFYLPTLPLASSSAAGLAFTLAQQPANLDSVWGLAARALSVAGVDGAQLLIAAVALGGLVVTYGLVVLPVAIRSVDRAAGAALATATLMLFTRVYSPQYSIWLLPFFVILPLSGRLFALLAFADVGVFLTVFPLTRVDWPAGDALAGALLGALAGFVVLRHVAIVWVWRAARRLAG